MPLMMGTNNGAVGVQERVERCQGRLMAGTTAPSDTDGLLPVATRSAVEDVAAFSHITVCSVRG